MKMKIQSLLELMDVLPHNESVIVDVLRGIVIDTIGDESKEKISYNVPYFYGHKGICIIWPSSIPRGGVEEGVLFGFWYGNLLSDKDNYLKKGNNRKVYYRIFKDVDEINVIKLKRLLIEAINLDKRWKN